MSDPKYPFKCKVCAKKVLKGYRCYHPKCQIKKSQTIHKTEQKEMNRSKQIRSRAFALQEQYKEKRFENLTCEDRIRHYGSSRRMYYVYVFEGKDIIPHCDNQDYRNFLAQMLKKSRAEFL